MDTVYVLSGGDFLADILNGVATLMGTSAWSSMFRIAMLVSVMVLFTTYLKGHDPGEIIRFLALFILLTSIMMLPKRTVQIIDRTDSTSVHTVANVPLGLAAPAKFITSLGTALTEGFETVYHTPGAITYSKTGMLFGASLVATATDFQFRNGDLAALFTAYVNNCVVGDMLLNHKYTFQELMDSRDPYALIVQNPSPLRGVMVSSGNTEANREGFWTCQELANTVLKTRLTADTSTGGKTWDYYVTRLIGRKANASALFGTLMADSYSYYYTGGLTASQIMRNAVVMNGLKAGISSWSAQNGNAAGLINLASQSSYIKMRLSQATAVSIATTYLPLMNTVLLAMVIGLFPVIVLLAAIHTLTMSMLKSYIFILVYLQAWGPMFAILNYAVSAWLTNKTGALSFSLSNLSLIRQTHTDIASVAGWLSLSIPVLAWGVVKGLGSAVSQAGNYLGTAMNSTASSEASRASDGLWAFNNLQTENVSGNKWDTNYAWQRGMSSTLLENGVMATRTGDGSMVLNTSGAISKLPVELMGDRLAQTGLQQLQRDAQSEIHSLGASLSRTTSSAASQLSQWASQRGRSDTVSLGSDNSISSNETTALNILHSITSRYARDNNISQAEALRLAIEKSHNLSLNAGIGGQIKFDTAKQFVGHLLRLGTGWNAAGDLHFKTDYHGQKGMSHGTSTDKSNRTSRIQDYSAQELKDIRAAVDVITSHRISDTRTHTDNASGSLLDQMSATFSTLRAQASQYSDTVNRSHEYAHLASYVEHHGDMIRSNYTQEFVAYTKQHHPDADRILTDVSSPVIRQERERLAGQFVKDCLLPQLENKYRVNEGHMPENTANILPPADLLHLSRNAFNRQQQLIVTTASARGVSGEGLIEGEVRHARPETLTYTASTQKTISQQKDEMWERYNEMAQTHQLEVQRFNEAHKRESERQNSLLDNGEN